MSAPVRERVVRRLAVLGCELDPAANRAADGAARVSTPDSRLAAVVMPTDEELMIAMETVQVLEG